ncbi:MAG TPA: hypothetical protein VD699_03035 [Nitrosopumilaceae archaeon]|nr:hypothetical protein [Nitrosopumilaceae archaeon]
MKKIENVTLLLQKIVEQKKKNKNNAILWWMRKGKGAIYVKVVNKMCIT